MGGGNIKQTSSYRLTNDTEKNTWNGKANASHSHTKSQITDFPSSLKNPNSLNINYNGTAVCSYDGSSTVNIDITPGVIGAVATRQLTPVHIVGIELDDGGAYIYADNSNIMFRYKTSSTADFSYANVANMASNIGTLNAQVAALETKIENSKVKSVTVTDSAVASESLNSAMQFGHYKYHAALKGTNILNKINELVNQGHTVLGGFLSKGPLNDTNNAANSANTNCIIASFSTYYSCPYQFSVYSDGYQTVRVEVTILYI